MLWKHAYLIKQFTVRDLWSRYKGSYLGILWSFVFPLLMLVIYTFVFSVVFESKWGTNVGESKVDFAIILFAGMTVFGLFSEVVNRAPGIIVSNVNYVKKVVFPLEIFPIVLLSTAFIQFSISCGILLFAILVFKQIIPWTVVFIPLVVFPLCLISLGLAWILSAVGVYLRDIGQILNVGVTALLFLSPIFYPVSAVPEKFRAMFQYNPLSYIVEDFRRVAIWGQMPHWGNWLLWSGIGLIFSLVGFYLFKKLRKGFADVL